MLVITRRIGEEIRVGDNVRIVLVDIRGSQVRIGVDAPREVPIEREEVYSSPDYQGPKAKAVG